MDDKLLIRMYDVGFGDCIYVQIPDGKNKFHMLIDCGTSADAGVLEEALDDMCSELKKDGRNHLDLLVATHPHADHIKGFNPAWFKGITIGRIWLTVFLKPDHPEAKKMMEFQNLADSAARGLRDRSGLHLAPAMDAVLKRSIWNPGALKALREDLAKSSKTYPQYPLYVARDLAQRQSEEQRKEYELGFEEGTTCFRGFGEKETCLRVLAPEWEIDEYYLGQGSFGGHPLSDPSLLGTAAYQAAAETGAEPLAGAAEAAKARQPGNISERDFRQLRSRLLYSGLAFSQKDDALKNNTSVVLLLEWHGLRLLFPGDAEWRGTGVEKSRRNGTWDVMLSIPEVKKLLLQRLDFLKVGHHGSHNGTPFREGGKEQVLDKILSAERTHLVVSTVTGVHGEEMPVPYAPLLETLGSLAVNKRRYPHAPEEELREKDQPQRTDLEPPVPGKKVRYVEVTLKAAE